MNTITLHDDQWFKLLSFLRTCPGVYVGRAEDCRRFVEGVLWIARSGAPWRLLPPQYGKWNSVYKRFARWCDQGVWERMLAHFADDPDMENVIVDSTVVRAHPCAAGASKKRWTGRSGIGTQSGRLQHQDSHLCGWPGQSIAFPRDCRAVSRHHPSARLDCRVHLPARHCRSGLRCRAFSRVGAAPTRDAGYSAAQRAQAHMGL